MAPSDDNAFARLVSLAAHDLRTPLATVHGFVRTIERTQELGDPLARYLSFIGEASTQMTDLLETLGLAARIESGRYEPALVEADTLELASEAAASVDGAEAGGRGERTETDPKAVRSGLAAFALCARRHGEVPKVTIEVDGRELALAPIGAAGPILLGDDLRDLGAAVATRTVRALGGTVAVDGGTLRVRL